MTVCSLLQQIWGREQEVIEGRWEGDSMFTTPANLGEGAGGDGGEMERVTVCSLLQQIWGREQEVMEGRWRG